MAVGGFAAGALLAATFDVTLGATTFTGFSVDAAFAGAGATFTTGVEAGFVGTTAGALAATDGVATGLDAGGIGVGVDAPDAGGAAAEAAEATGATEGTEVIKGADGPDAGVALTNATAGDDATADAGIAGVSPTKPLALCKLGPAVGTRPDLAGRKGCAGVWAENSE